MNKKETKADATLGANPFAGEDFRIPVSRDLRLHPKVSKLGKAPQHLLIDRERHMKVFISDKKRDVLMNLSERAKSMILFIQCYTPQRKDFIELSASRYTKETGVRSRVTFTLARAELINNNIIGATSIPGVYWLNPRYLFPGSRVHHYPNNHSHDPNPDEND